MCTLEISRIQNALIHVFAKTSTSFLQTNFREARRRIVIASLYLGTGQLEKDLVRGYLFRGIDQEKGH
jgi:hypothetical protein